MTEQRERRKALRNPDDTLSPELVALLLQCGGAVREADRTENVGSEMLWDRRRPERRRNKAP